MADETQSGGPQRTGVPPLEETLAGAEPERRTASIADTAKEQAGAAWDETRANMRSALDEQRQAAASGVGDVAGALRHAARELDGEQKTSSARLVQHAADGLERLAGTLRTRDLQSMVRDAEDFARREPGLFLGAAVAVGFLATRFLKSSSERERSPHQAVEPSESGQPSERGHLH